MMIVQYLLDADEARLDPGGSKAPQTEVRRPSSSR